MPNWFPMPKPVILCAMCNGPLLFEEGTAPQGDALVPALHIYLCNTCRESAIKSTASPQPQPKPMLLCASCGNVLYSEETEETCAPGSVSARCSIHPCDICRADAMDATIALCRKIGDRLNALSLAPQES